MENMDLMKYWKTRIQGYDPVTIKGRYGSPIDPSTQTPGPSQFVNQEEDDEELSGKFDEESKALLRDIYLKAAREYGFMPTLKDFRDYLGRSGVPTEEFSDDSLTDALRQIYMPHGGSDNMTNLRTPGAYPG